MGRRALFISVFLAFIVASVIVLTPWLGENFFPAVDSGEIKLHVRDQAGTRIEETARLCDQIENTIRQLIPADQLAGIIDNIGLPVSGINITYSNSAPIGPADADILIDLKGNHGPTDDYVKTAAGAPAAPVSPGDLCVPPGGHRQPDPEFRAAGAD